MNAGAILAWAAVAFALWAGLSMTVAATRSSGGSMAAAAASWVVAKLLLSYGAVVVHVINALPLLRAVTR